MMMIVGLGAWVNQVGGRLQICQSCHYWLVLFFKQWHVYTYFSPFYLNCPFLTLVLACSPEHCLAWFGEISIAQLDSFFVEENWNFCPWWILLPIHRCLYLSIKLLSMRCSLLQIQSLQQLCCRFPTVSRFLEVLEVDLIYKTRNSCASQTRATPLADQQCSVCLQSSGTQTTPKKWTNDVLFK